MVCSNSKEPAMPEEKPLEQRIRERAYFFWIEEGEPEGRDKLHWEAAQKVVVEEDRQREEAEKQGIKPPPGPSFGP
jgi:Protein of unknown function (DUF2934)